MLNELDYSYAASSGGGPKSKLYCATSLLAQNEGDAACFYCGAPANLPLKLSGSFVDWWIVAAPESDRICQGCEVSLREKIAIPGKEKLQKTRNYSWLVTAENATPYTKSHKHELREILLNPPSPPWALAIAESGQKHLLYRTPVNRDDPPYQVRLEMEIISYTTARLAGRLELTRRVVAQVGHKVAADPASNPIVFAVPELLESWLAVYRKPVTRLALFVTPSQKECQDADPRT